MNARHCRAEGDDIRCLLCPHGCLLPEGGSGRCLARSNRGGILSADSYGTVTSLALDPIEKKPLYHFHPGSRILSIGSYGCNMACYFCQNHSISTERAPGRSIFPDELALISRKLEGESIGVAFTYNEPLVGFEYVSDCAALIKSQGQRVVLVTNGHILPGPLSELLPLVDALNIDLKCFTREGYRSLGGAFDTVRESIRLAAERCHLEVTTLIVPGLSDGREDMKSLSSWLAEISPDIPLHVSRYFPRHKADAPATPVGDVRALADVARASLRHVYIGNCR